MTPFLTTLSRGLVLGLSGVLLMGLAGCGDRDQASKDDSAAAVQPASDRCAALMQLGKDAFPDPTTMITATYHTADEAPPPPPPGAPPGVTPAKLPANCEVTGHFQDREGANGQHYAIKFRLRLPDNWNGRFLYEGSGGSNGNVSAATGPVINASDTALNRGFAVINDDSGHDNATNNDPARQGTQTFGHDFEARRNYGYAAYDDVALLAKALIDRFYGKPANRSYFMGCSNGGREGMVFAHRYPDVFDGIIAAAPGFSLPKVGLAHAWDTQAFAKAARALGEVDDAGQPKINRSFSDADLALVSQSVVDACDELDGLKDGIINDFPHCTLDKVKAALAKHMCQGGKQEGCLVPPQVTSLETVYAGAMNGEDEPLYASFPWDRGMGGKLPNGYDQGWRLWKLGGYAGMPQAGLIVLLGGPSSSAVFITPPVDLPNTPAANLNYLLNFDFDEDSAKIFATTAAFPESAWDMISARSPDIEAFRAHGGKMIVPQGVSDPVFSLNDTLTWWDEVNGRDDGNAADFVRVFPVPGMTHCAGGAATDRFDALTALVAWVEDGKAPDRIEAKAGANTPWPGRTRPLCPYPKIARYTGEGSIEDAANFTCQ